MVELVTAFVVNEDFRGRLELIFGPGGAWSSLFGKSPGFRGTTLLGDIHQPGRYLTIDYWDSEAEREQALAAAQADFEALAADLATWAETRTELGIFTARAQATVHPARKGKKSRYRRR